MSLNWQLQEHELERTRAKCNKLESLLVRIMGTFEACVGSVNVCMRVRAFALRSFPHACDSRSNNKHRASQKTRRSTARLKIRIWSGLLSQHKDDQRIIEGLRCRYVRACCSVFLHPYLVLLSMRVNNLTITVHLLWIRICTCRRLRMLFRADCNLSRPMANIASGGCTSP